MKKFSLICIHYIKKSKSLKGKLNNQSKQVILKIKRAESFRIQKMHINDPDFVRRRILRGINEYSPKRRWDQNAFGSERRMLINHVEKTLKEHENDGDILEKFKKDAEELKEKKRREKFPYLFNSKNSSSQNLLLQTVKKAPPTNYVNEFQQPLITQPPQQQPQQFKQKQSFTRVFQHPPILQPISHFPPFAIPTPNPYQLQARLQYQRTLAQKDLQLYKKEQKIKRQKKEINRLYRQLKEKQKEDELEKFIKSHEEINKMNQMLADMKDQITSRKSLLQNSRKDVLVDAHEEADRKRNKSQVYLNSYNSMALVKEHVRDRTKDVGDVGFAVRQSPLLVEKSSPTSRRSVIPMIRETSRNPQVEYSPQIKKNRSSVFEKVPLYNPPILKNNSLNQHLDELKNYNKRLEYLHDYNHSKFSQMA